MQKTVLTILLSRKFELFLFASFILHIFFISIFRSSIKLSPEHVSPSTKFTVTLSPPEATAEKSQKIKLKQQPKRKIQKQPPTTQILSAKTEDSWKKGMDKVKEIIQQPGYLENLFKKQSIIPNYRDDLFNTKESVTKATIESFNDQATGDVIVVFRYPSGKVICARIREPDPFDNFDRGSWTVEVNGCK